MAHSSSNVLAAFLGGALLGGLAALLLAPKSGKELREELKELAEREAERCGCEHHSGHGCCHHKDEVEEEQA